MELAWIKRGNSALGLGSLSQEKADFGTRHSSQSKTHEKSPAGPTSHFLGPIC